LGVYDIATDFEDFVAEEGLAFDGDWESPPPSPPSSSSTGAWGVRRSIDALSSADTTAGYRTADSIGTQLYHSASIAASTIPIPTAMVVHEWGQKSGLMGKELARHVVYKLTEKEVEMCRLQMKDLVRRRKQRVDSLISRSFSMSSEGVSRRSSSASSMGPWQVQGYAFAYGRKNGLPGPGPGLNFMRQGRGHRHSSSMSEVGRAANGMEQAYGFGGCGSGVAYRYGSVSWADQYRSRMVGSSSRKAALMEEDYVIF
jgi:hypothetical protein